MAGESILRKPSVSIHVLFSRSRSQEVRTESSKNLKPPQRPNVKKQGKSKTAQQLDFTDGSSPTQLRSN